MGILNDVTTALELEIDALRKMASRLDDNVVRAVSLILSAKGRIIFIGMGKAGHVARKLSATFSSTGTPSIFMHPGEAYHGDLGVVTRNDLAIIISNSGETEEVVKLLPHFKRFRVPVVSLTGNLNSTLAMNSEVALDTGVEREACPLNCAPTSSTTTAIALGDALACALITARGFKQEDFAAFHPGGSLGSKLLLTVDELMVPMDETPVIGPEASVQDAIVAITSGRVGAVFVLDDSGRVQGIFTDGDLRRFLQKGDLELDVAISDVMTMQPKSINRDELAVTAMAAMEESKISVLAVVDDNECACGVVQIHMLLQAGIV